MDAERRAYYQRIADGALGTGFGEHVHVTARDLLRLLARADEADRLAARVEALEKKLDEVAPWSCPECGDHVAIDLEDGTCANCGRDAALRGEG